MATKSVDIYQQTTDRIMAMLEAGVAPWRSPILGRLSAGFPRNLHSDKPYRGVNVFLLAFTAWAEGYGSSYWLTFNQAKGRGGSVRKGEKASPVVFWKPYETEDKDTGEAKTVPVLRYYNVFNAEQCEGIMAPDAIAPDNNANAVAFESIAAAANIATGYQDGPVVQHGGERALYRPRNDTVRLPEPSRFTSPEAYYATLFHELAHHADLGIMPHRMPRARCFPASRCGRAA